MLPLQSLAGSLCAFLALSLSSAGQSLNSNIVIVSNNDLNPSNTNRASALFLKSSVTCEEAQQSCGELQESLLPAPISTGLTAENVTAALTSERHGANIHLNQHIWIAGGCAVFTVGTSHTCDADTSLDLSNRYPTLCTNTAPLTRSNVTSYDTSRQIEVSTPSAGGIKFAESTAGAETAVRDALEYGPRCAQPPNVDNGHRVWTEEDCLQLNVYSPTVVGGQAADCTPSFPVMFFIHGGGLNHGDSGPFPYNMTTSGYVGPSVSNIFDGTNLVSHGGVVLVTINYRLTTLGWFNASNAALKDTLLALQWVQDNIEAFGGDPTKVLIYGESAGGIMTRYLLGTNPKYTEGLFSTAILESDFGTSNPFSSPQLALNTSLELAKYVGCASNSSTILTESDVECVANTSAGDLATASYNLRIAWTIVVDGDYVLNDIASSIMDWHSTARVPIIWAANQCEYCYFLPTTLTPDSPPSSFVSELSHYFNETQIQRILNQTELYPYETAPSSDGISGAVLQLAQLLTDWFVHCPGTHLASLSANTTNRNVYKILFNVGLGSTITPRPTTCIGQVCHADELYLVFATAETDNLYQPLTDFQVSVTQEIIKRWTSFAWTGDPNYEGAVQWPPYTGDNEYVLGLTGNIQPYRVDQCDFIRTQLGLVYGVGTY
ncbi:alpha beta-hydrolase [Suillus lakei]|nr:alpha beta-hydrolase [Suillus lakei]